MRVMLRVIVPMLAALMSLVTLPAAAAEGLQPAIMTAESVGSVVPVMFKSGIHMEVEELVAVIAGAIVVSTVVDMFFEGGIVTAAAIAGGAALGSHWYEERLWPFEH